MLPPRTASAPVPPTRPDPLRARRLRRAAAPVALVAVSAMLLGGCAVAQSITVHPAEVRFSDYEEAVAGWPLGDIPAWIPEDGKDIWIKYLKSKSQSIIHVRTKSDPVEGQCAEAPPVGTPTILSSWSPDIPEDTVLDCGDYQLVDIGGGWFGWNG